MGVKFDARAEVICPFYCSDDRRSDLICEGVVHGSRIMQKFQRKADMKKHLETFCSASPEKCELYKMLMRTKYVEEI